MRGNVSAIVINRNSRQSRQSRDSKMAQQVVRVQSGGGGGGNPDAGGKGNFMDHMRQSLIQKSSKGHRHEMHDIVGHHECFLSEHAAKDPENQIATYRQTLVHIIQHWGFDFLAAMVILCNALVMGVSAEIAIRYHADNPNAQQMKSHKFVEAASYVFFVFYFSELIMRLVAFRFAFFTGRDWKWNVLDLVLVLTAIYDLVEQESEKGFGKGNVSFLRLLRLLKMAKMLRLFRVMKFFRELRVMMYAIIGSIRLLFWALIMLSIITYVFGLIFLQGVNLKLAEENIDMTFRDEILLLYGSVPQSMVTLYEAITGGNDWAPLAAPLKHCGEGYYWLFLFYIAFLTFTVLNVLTGVVVEAAMMITEIDADNVSDEFIGKEITDTERLQGLVDGIELNGDGYIQWDELMKDSATEKMRHFLDNIDVDFEEVEGFFRLMQIHSGNSNGVKVKDFIKGVGNMKLWGPSKSIESFVLLRNLKSHMKSVEANFQRVFACFERQGVEIPAMSEVKIHQEPEEEMFDDFGDNHASESDDAPLILSSEWEVLFDECHDAEVLRSVGNRANIRMRELRREPKQASKSMSPMEMKAGRPVASQPAQTHPGAAQELVSRLAGLIVQEATPLLLQELESSGIPTSPHAQSDKQAKAPSQPEAHEYDPEPKLIGSSVDRTDTGQAETKAMEVFNEADESSERPGLKPVTQRKFHKKKNSKAAERREMSHAPALASNESLGGQSDIKGSN